MKSLRRMIAARAGRVLCGLDVGFSDAAVSAEFRALCGGQWMTVVADEQIRAAVAPALPAGTVHRIGAESALPFEDFQFDVVVLDGSDLSLPLVREIHRVLKSGGRLFFETEELVRHGNGSTSAKIYNSFLRSGFNVTSLVRSPWWTNFLGVRTLTVCATRKNWRDMKGGGAR